MTRASRTWTWVGACSTGTSHLGNGSGCDDAAACLEVHAPSGAALLAVVSDGAGSAHLSRHGSRIVTLGFCRAASAFLTAGGDVRDIDEALATDWLDDVRDRINQAASDRSDVPRSFAATLVGAIVQREGAAIVHVGDGACAVRLSGRRGWQIPSWPAQGEFAGTTNFVTDDPTPRVVVTSVKGEVEEIAVFSDGLERLALDFGTVTAFDRFFETTFPAIRKRGPGRQRSLSRDLRAFLDGPSVTDRTDDDKTLIMARRVKDVGTPEAAARQ